MASSDAVVPMMLAASLSLLMLALTSNVVAAPLAIDADYPEVEVVNEKRAALVLDRLFVAIRNALRRSADSQTEGQPAVPQAMPLRVAHQQINRALRGQSGAARGRVLRCYFNAITCF